MVKCGGWAHFSEQILGEQWKADEKEEEKKEDEVVTPGAGTGLRNVFC